nr:MAG TPA: hypothetical protein [Caudoviricetes sp.]
MSGEALPTLAIAWTRWGAAGDKAAITRTLSHGKITGVPVIPLRMRLNKLELDYQPPHHQSSSGGLYDTQSAITKVNFGVW